MEPRKSGNKKIKYIFYLILLLFTCLYFAGKTGYYENKLSKKTALTKEAILEFERDVAEGKSVDIKDYIDSNNIDYNNKYSTLGLTISNTIDVVINDGVGYLVKILEALFS